MAIQTERRFTYQDLLHLPADGRRYEVLDGALEVNAAPNTAHQRTVLNLAAIIHAYVRAHRLGEVFVAPYDVLLADSTVVEPDLVFVSSARAAIILPAHIQGVPDLVVEVLSPSTARVDLQVKWQLYARFGVPHYWVFDSVEREAVAYGLVGGAYQESLVARGAEPFAAPPFSDLAIPLGDVWE